MSDESSKKDLFRCGCIYIEKKGNPCSEKYSAKKMDGSRKKLSKMNESDVKNVLRQSIIFKSGKNIYTFEGEAVCMKTFAYLHNMTEKDLRKHVKSLKNTPEQSSSARKSPRVLLEEFREMQRNTLPPTIGVLPRSQVIKTFGSININSIGISPTIMNKYGNSQLEDIWYDTNVKVCPLLEMVSKYVLEILALQETKLQQGSAKVFDDLITKFGFGYKAYHVWHPCPYDLRAMSRWPMRGLAVLVKNDIRVIDVSAEKKPETFDCQVLLLNESVLFLNVYNPPGALNKFYKEFTSFIEYVKEKYKGCTLLVCGDFNCPGQKGEKLKNEIRNLALIQHVKEPTRQKNVLDLVLSYDKKFDREIEVVKVTFSDHKLVLGTLNFSQDPISSRESAMASEI